MLSIAIVLHNSVDGLDACLQSIRSDVESGWAEVIAVDNASPDDSIAVLRQRLPAARLITLERNCGFAGGINKAFESASGNYWLMLNPDVCVPVGGLKQLVSWLDRHPAIGAASPDIVAPDGAWQSPGRAFPSVLRVLLEASRLHRLLPARLRGRLLRGAYWTGGSQLDAGWVPGTAMIVRQAAAQAAGPLREDLFMYGEDLEWCWRLRRAGWRIGVCAETLWSHGDGTSAIRTWGASDRESRMAGGIDAACRIMYGNSHARILAAATATALALEAHAPGRSEGQRRNAASAALAWRRLALRRQRGPAGCSPAS